MRDGMDRVHMGSAKNGGKKGVDGLFQPLSLSLFQNNIGYLKTRDINYISVLLNGDCVHFLLFLTTKASRVLNIRPI